MHLVIAWQRHVAISDSFPNATPLFGSPPGIIMWPLGKIQTLAPIVHMTDEPPGHGRHVTVPRPFGFVGMTVVTRAMDQRHDLLRWSICRKNILPRNQRRILQRRID